MQSPITNSQKELDEVGQQAMMDTMACSKWGTGKVSQFIKSNYFVNLETSSEEDVDIQEATQQLEGELASDIVSNADFSLDGDSDANYTKIQKLNRKLSELRARVSSG